MPHNRQKLRTDVEALRETACSYAEEFARMGHDGPAILRMFQSPFYRAAYAAYRALGHAASAAIINECLAIGTLAVRRPCCGDCRSTHSPARLSGSHRLALSAAAGACTVLRRHEEDSL